MIRTLFAGPVSACFEIENNLAYFNDSEYSVSLDGKELFRAKTNVFSLFGLLPGREYTLSVTGHEPLAFRTASETCAVSVMDFGA
ncbi:MAG: glycoside hydrolase family 28 protein, partial [Ruminiclostridium sp.]|nr:glycoside hydrolase family 28 protein [Ruminiclostridium sp.]